MKKAVAILLFILMSAFLLTACSKGDAPEKILVMIEEGEGYTPEQNGLLITPGEDALFTLSMERSVSLIRCDYPADYSIDIVDGQTLLTLKNVKYPTRVTLTLSSTNCAIQYEPNGGLSMNGTTDSVLKNYSITSHLRPNTSIGTDLFYRDGYTLTSWNTKADGSGTYVGLGSRVTIYSGTLTLYAQWSEWTSPEDFTWSEVDGALTITSYNGRAGTIVIPSMIEGKPVKAIQTGTFYGTTADSVILPPSMDVLEEGAFDSCTMTELTIFDNLATFSDQSFINCSNLQTLHIIAIEAPYGYLYRKESCYADKMDLLILAAGQKKMVFYGGCSMWYNLDCRQMDNTFGSEYRILDVALNGTVSSAVQMQIMAQYLEEGDILFHTPELSSKTQLMFQTEMVEDDCSLWCGLEMNYDLFALVDLRTVSGVFNSLYSYLSIKDGRCDYNQFYSDDYMTPYMDSYGGMAIYRSKTSDKLADTVGFKVYLDDTTNLATLGSYYAWYRSLGIQIYVSYACLNMDALPEQDVSKIDTVEADFSTLIYEYTGRGPVSTLADYQYVTSDFYDTNYHLLTARATDNTALWLRDLKAAMIEDHLWKEGK